MCGKEFRCWCGVCEALPRPVRIGSLELIAIVVGRRKFGGKVEVKRLCLVVVIRVLRDFTLAKLSLD